MSNPHLLDAYRTTLSPLSNDDGAYGNFNLRRSIYQDEGEVAQVTEEGKEEVNGANEEGAQEVENIKPR